MIKCTAFTAIVILTIAGAAAAVGRPAGLPAGTGSATYTVTLQ